MLLCRVVDQNVECSELSHRLLHCLLAELFIAHIASDQDTLCTMILDELPRLFRIFMLVEINNRNVGAFLGESDSDGAPDSAIATADKCHFPLEFPAPAMALVFCLRPRSHLVLTSRLLRLCLFWLFFLFCWHMIQFLRGSRGIRPKRENQTC